MARSYGAVLRKPNLDCQGKSLRKGVNVLLPGGATCRVLKVRCGQFWPDLPGIQRVYPILCEKALVLDGGAL